MNGWQGYAQPRPAVTIISRYNSVSTSVERNGCAAFGWDTRLGLAGLTSWGQGLPALCRAECLDYPIAAAASRLAGDLG